MVPMIDI